MHHIVEQEREGGGDGAVGKVAAAQLAECSADDRLHGEFGPGLQRATLPGGKFSIVIQFR